jgi:hypothetical protein
LQPGGDRTAADRRAASVESGSADLPPMMLPIFHASAAPPVSEFTITPETTDDEADRLLFSED